MSEIAKIIQQQRLENKNLDFFQIPRDRLSDCLKLSVKNKRTLLLTRGINVSHQKSLDLIIRSLKEEDLTVFGIYAGVNKFLFEVNRVVGSLFKVWESYSEAHLYLKENFVKEHPAPLNVAVTNSHTSFLPSPPEEKRSDIFKDRMLDLGVRSVIGNQRGNKVSFLDIMFKIRLN
jgi:hypothetical protein